MASSDTKDPLGHLAATTRVLTAGCYCKAVRFTVTVATSDLPLATHLCSCTICRYTHGTMSTFHAPLPALVSPVFEPADALETGVLTGYKTPNSERFFCTTCGCHVGDVDHKADKETGHREWRVATSIFDEHGEDVFLIQSHVFATPSQGSGGMIEWLPAIGDREMRVWNPEPGQEEHFPEASRPPPKQDFDDGGNEVLRAECHCGGVRFTIPRPTSHGIPDDPVLKTWISPVEPTKWAASLDSCDHCRLMNGAHVIGWAYIPLFHTKPRVPQSFTGFGTLKAYESTPNDVLRGFCGVCGATVFYSCASRTPSPEQQVVDVSVGILRAPEGLSAEKWLTWRTGRVGYSESGMRYDPVFAESLRKGHEAWGRGLYDGESLDFKLGPNRS